nr:MAG TPA: major tropism determinant [Caudoviricetes sp.]
MPRNTKQPIQFYRGTTAQHSGYTGPAGECTVDTTKSTLVVHDGKTAGGHPLVKESHIVTGDGYVLANGSRSTTIGSDALALSLDTDALKALLSDPTGTGTTAGNLKLSDAIDSGLDAATGGTAATPKAVKTAVDGAVKKTYAVKGDTYIKVDGKASTTLGEADGLDLTLNTAALKSALADPTATNVVSGNNMLSDAVDSSLDAATGGTAATPKAVKAAYDLAASKASDDLVVHIRNNETIEDVKTFLQGPYGTTSAMTTSEVDLSKGVVFSKTISADTTFTFINVPSGRAATLNIILTNGGSAAITWPTSVKWTDGVAPTLTSSGVDVLTFMTPDGGTTWYGTLAITNAS